MWTTLISFGKYFSDRSAGTVEVLDRVKCFEAVHLLKESKPSEHLSDPTNELILIYRDDT